MLAGTRGAGNRLRIIEVLLERPMNAKQLASQLALDYRTVRHHLDILLENGILARPEGDAYGAKFYVSGFAIRHLGTMNQISSFARGRGLPAPASRGGRPAPSGGE